MLSPVSTWMGDRLGTLDAAGLNFFARDPRQVPNFSFPFSTPRDLDFFYKIHNFKVSFFTKNHILQTSNPWEFLDKKLILTLGFRCIHS